MTDQEKINKLQERVEILQENALHMAMVADEFIRDVKGELKTRADFIVLEVFRQCGTALVRTGRTDLIKFK